MGSCFGDIHEAHGACGVIGNMVKEKICCKSATLISYARKDDVQWSGTDVQPGR